MSNQKYEPLSMQDVQLIKALAFEREKLLAQAAELSDTIIAEKFETSVARVSRIINEAYAFNAANGK